MRLLPYPSILARGVGRSLLRVLAAVTALAVFAPREASAVYVSPQAAAINGLRAASRIPLQIRVDTGIARVVGMDVSVGGTTPLIRVESFLRSYGALFEPGAGPDLDRVLARQDRTATGEDAISYAQRYKGLPIFGSRLTVLVRPSAAGGPAGEVALATTNFLPAVQLDTVPMIDATSAETLARMHLGRTTPSLGQTTLMVFDPRLFAENGPTRLVWSVQLDGDGSVTVARRVLVDAHDGTVPLEYDLVQEAGLSDFDLLLFDADFHQNSSSICAQNRNTSVFAGNVFGVVPAYQSDVDATLAWTAARATYLYYLNTFGRESWDDNDALVPLAVDSSVDNGQFSPGCQNIQIRSGWVGIDVIAHEFTHGVIDHESDLVYNGQSGALNEGFADVGGALVDGADWLLAEDRTNGNGAIRSMADPPGKHCGTPGNLKTCGQPDRRSVYVFTSDDNGGVHTNSGIPNKAHYLMAQGGSFNGVTVQAIGRTKLAYVAYSAMRLLPSTASFLDARNYEVAAATTLAQFSLQGFTASNVCSVRNAWAAVEVGAPDLNCDGVEEGTTDTDGDGVPNSVDNCDFASNPDQKDWNNDGTGDVCDPQGDDDNDGLPNAIDKCPHVASASNFDSDGDGLGDPCDTDDDNDGVLDTVDNCPYDPNPSQFDGNMNGEGDACDPDQDGDGLYVEADNCTFVSNPGQQDADGDGLGDACDKCPNVSDNANAYTVPLFGDPQPLQPDSDGDGVPDACDGFAFGTVGVAVNGLPFNPTKPVKPDGKNNGGRVEGPAGGIAKIPFPPCDPLDPDGLTADQRVELIFTGLDDHVRVRVTDDIGRVLGVARPGTPGAGPPPSGLRFKPDCGRGHMVELELLPGFLGSDDFAWLARVVTPTGENPWQVGDRTVLPPPTLLDPDGDGLISAIDRCPSVADPENLDGDGDGVGDACDNCPYAANASQLDRGGIGSGSRPNGVGDACECGDVNDDGVVTAIDSVLIARALLQPPTATMAAPQRCDVGGPLGCSLGDAVIVRRALLQPATATIVRQCDPATP